MTALRHTWFMTLRQGRNLMREPIWIALLLVQPMVWLVLYGQLFKNVTRLGGFGTTSYITFLAPAIVVMNAFFGATWSGMGMIADLDRKVVERFLAVIVKGIAWFEDLNNRDQAVRLMVATSKLKQEDVEKSYDFLRGKHLFEPTGKVSKAKLNVIHGALRELGDVPAAFPVDRLFLPGVTQVVD